MLTIPAASFLHHCNRNDFSRWLFARTEMALAAQVRPISDDDFSDVESHAPATWSTIMPTGANAARRASLPISMRQTRISIPNFSRSARAHWVEKPGDWPSSPQPASRQNTDLAVTYKGVDILVPQTLVITTDGFESFVEDNQLRYLSKADLPDEQIAEQLPLKVDFPDGSKRNCATTCAQGDLSIGHSILQPAGGCPVPGLCRTLPHLHDAPMTVPTWSCA
jgi:hypothetical protein